MAESIDSHSDFDDDITDDCLTESFNKAADHVKKLVGNLQPPKLLEIYSYYKQASEGPCNIPKPRFYELQAKAKWEAWNKLGDLSPSDAKKEYIKIISELDETFDPDPNRKTSSESWVTVSSLLNTDELLNENDKTVFDFCKEDNLSQLKTSIEKNSNLLNAKDENGLGLIHWAADRGNLEILQFLISAKVDINMTDEDGQTALHYAASCDHIKCVEFLLNSGSNHNITDSSGYKPIDLADNENIKLLLRKEK